MTTTIAGHILTPSQLRTLNAVQDYLRKNSGDSWASSSTSPKGDGRAVSTYEVFGRSNQATHHRRNIWKLWNLGVLKACEIDYGPRTGLQLKPGREISLAAKAGAN